MQKGMTPEKHFLTHQGECSDELIEAVATWTRPAQAQAKQNPRTDEGR